MENHLDLCITLKVIRSAYWLFPLVFLMAIIISFLNGEKAYIKKKKKYLWAYKGQKKR